MTSIPAPRRYICAHGVRAKRIPNHLVAIASSSVRQHGDAAAQRKEHRVEVEQEQGQEQDEHTAGEQRGEGALTRRLRSMSEEALETGGHSALKVLEGAGFSAELKAQLEQRIAAANFKSSEADLPTTASRRTRDLATAEAWSGTESIHDASLRMLNDAHRPMRLGRPPKLPGVQPPRSVDTGYKRSKEGRGLRLANARDRSTFYASVKDDADMEAADREKRLQELKDRFDPHARVIVPGSIQGLASLANKRIEDAIARGQFKNLPRGKGKNVKRDHNASSPFIDTTEYFMNKIIQKQDIVPPWIEKQQELTSTAAKFRSRLRNDWTRHAARMISSKGGSLQDQIRRAEAYAQAEVNANPLKKQESLTTVDNEGHLSQISLSGGLKMNSSQETLPGRGAVITEEITAERITLDSTPCAVPRSLVAATVTESSIQTVQVPISTPSPTVPPAPHPFRDPDWERIEFTYQTLAIKDLNDKARSYNLQAPELAKRPYFNLQRELKSCYADVAPRLAGVILDRARGPPKKTNAELGVGRGDKKAWGGLVGGPVRVRDERREKQYGFRQFWNDLWADKSSNPY